VPVPLTPARRRAGFALPAVLATLIVLALVAVALVRFMGTAQQGGESQRRVSQIDHALDAALIQGLNILHDDRHALRAVLLAGRPVTVGTEPSQISLSMSRDGGHIDVNAARDNLLLPALNLVLGQEAGSAALRRATEQRTSRATAFDPLELLPRRIAYGDEGARFLALFTVYSGQSGINPFVAPEAVLKAVPGVDETMLQDLRALREQGGISSAILSSEAAPYFSSGTDVVTLVATSAAGRSRAMTARVAQGSGRPSVLAVRNVPAPAR
jgi:hypothetical protein